MKIALYIEDGLEQVVLTPESDTERRILERIHDGSREISLKRGSFYNCQGGWVRNSSSQPSSMFGSVASDDQSTMIVLKARLSSPTPGDLYEGD